MLLTKHVWEANWRSKWKLTDLKLYLAWCSRVIFLKWCFGVLPFFPRTLRIFAKQLKFYASTVKRWSDQVGDLWSVKQRFVGSDSASVHYYCSSFQHPKANGTNIAAPY